MSAIDLGLSWQGCEFDQRVPQDWIGCLEDAATPQGEERIATKGDFLFLEIIDDVSERMARRLQDFRFQRSDAREVALSEKDVEKGNPRCVFGRPMNLEARKPQLQLGNRLDMIGMMVRDENVRQAPTAFG